MAKYTPDGTQSQEIEKERRWRERWRDEEREKEGTWRKRRKRRSKKGRTRGNVDGKEAVEGGVSGGGARRETSVGRRRRNTWKERVGRICLREQRKRKGWNWRTFFWLRETLEWRMRLLKTSKTEKERWKMANQRTNCRNGWCEKEDEEIFQEQTRKEAQECNA